MVITDELIENVMDLADEFLEVDEIADKLGVQYEVVLDILLGQVGAEDYEQYNEDDWRLIDDEDVI